MANILRPGSIGNLTVRKAHDTPYMNAIIFGQPGVGKTRLLGSLAEVPELSPVLFLDPEHGTMSLRGKHDVDVIAIKEYQDYATIHNALHNKDLPYKSVVIDSITEMSFLGLEEIVDRSVQDAILKGRTHDIDQPEIQDYGKNGIRINKIIRFFRALPCNVFFTALEHTNVTRPTRPMLVPALNTKRLSAELPGAVDLVLYLFTKEEDGVTHRVLMCNRYQLGNLTIMAKDRSDTLPLTIRNPTMQDVYDYYSGAKTKDEE